MSDQNNQNNSNNSIIMRITMSESQADAQFVCLFDRMSKKIANISKNMNRVAGGEYNEHFSKLDPKTHLKNFTPQETYFADIVLNIMDYCNQNNIRLGETLLASVDSLIK